MKVNLFIFNFSREILTYYGKMFGVDNLKSRINEVLEMLDLNEKKLSNKQLSLLSGGQQRRVSLACAMIHKPKILVL